MMRFGAAEAADAASVPSPQDEERFRNGKLCTDTWCACMVVHVHSADHAC